MQLDWFYEPSSKILDKYRELTIMVTYMCTINITYYRLLNQSLTFISVAHFTAENTCVIVY